MGKALTAGRDSTARLRAAAPWALAGGILATSTGAIFVRFAQRDVPSLTIAAGRLGIATLVLTPWVLARHRGVLRSLTPRQLALASFAGVCLAAHFATWIRSLEYTSVLSSLVLVTTTPLWVALVAPWVLGERLGAGRVLGVLVAIAGGALVAASDATRAVASSAHPHALTGDLLALAGAVAGAAYLLAGRRLRGELALAPYVFVVYGVAAVVLCTAALVRGPGPASVPAPAWGWLVLLALVPQLAGHTTLNWALRHLPASGVAVALLGEPIAAALLAWLILGEQPTPTKAAGAALALVGIAWASRGGAVES